MTITRTNKNAITAPKKNILPPFGDKGWINAGNGARDVVANGSELGFSTSGAWYGFIYDIPLSYAGKTLSISVEEARGSKPEVKLSWAIGDSWDSKVIKGSGKSENVKIPSNVTILRVYVQSGGGSTGGYFYFRGVQLEEGSASTKFDYKVGINKKKKKRKVIKAVVADFNGKIAGSILENPHIMRGNAVSNSIQSPTQSWDENVQSNYELAKALDGQLRVATGYANGVIAQHLFSFNVIEEVERAFPRFFNGLKTLSEKIARLKSESIKTTCKWYGYGNSSTGNKATLGRWNRSANAFDYKKSHLSSETSLITLIDSVLNIDSDGFVHYISYAEVSNGEKPSVINTDYIEVEFQLWVEEDSKRAVKNNSKNNLITAPPTDMSWEKQNGASVRKVDELFMDNEVFEVTLAGSLPRIFQTIKRKGIFSGKVYVKILEGEGNSTALYFRQTNFGEAYAGVNLPATKSVWTEVKIANCECKDEFMFLLYQPSTGKPATKFLMSMAQVEEASSFSDYKTVNKVPKVNKSPIVKYPFDFKRESVEVINGIQYGINNPRNKDGGIFIEEDTENILRLSKWVTYLADRGALASREADVNSIMRIRGSVFAGVKSRAGVSIADSYSNPTKDATIKFYYRLKSPSSGRLTFYADIRTAGDKDVSFGALTDYQDLRNKEVGKWYEYKQSITFPVAMEKGSHYIWVDGGNDLDSEFDIEIREIQFEGKLYTTSFTERRRDKEYAILPKKIIDNIGGSVEFTYIPSNELSEQKNIGRTFIGSTDKFRVWSWPGGRSHIGVDYAGNDGTRQYIDYNVSSDVFKVGKPIKLKFSWGNQKVELYVNDVKVGESGASKPFRSLDAENLYIGRSQSESTPMNGIYKDLVFKDRDGKITYKI
ncbi:hypothetical protein [Bacillus cereus]|uniref:hypothetical protein n=1 Tax=Bacillus cereus TaxID=1396 RepID=UPI000BFD926A|nr:hypothetical protein [Bacillus cereus]PGU82139.1 hypothetical protein COD76_11640 [Bacillus cereus]